jgi:uroporphyrinogen decarboxylase
LAFESKKIYQIRDDLLQFNLNWIDKWLKFDYDGLHFADDWGMQNGLMISPEIWRKIFKPAYKAMFEKVIAVGLDVHYHSDGNIIDILPDFIEMGVKVINCQICIMDLDKIRQNYAGKICFRTDLDRQQIMPFGSPQQVREHILDVFKNVGTSKGGIIACGEISPDIPLENIRMMYDTFAKYYY